MKIPVKVTSKVSGRVVEGSFTPRQLIDASDEDDLVTELTMCNCRSLGETNVIECSCEEEWCEYELLIGGE